MAWYYAYYARTLFLFWRRKYVKATSVVISDGGSFSKTLVCDVGRDINSRRNVSVLDSLKKHFE